MTQTVKCTACGSTDIARWGKTKYGKQKYRCNSCGKQGSGNTTFTVEGEPETKNNNMENQIGISISEFRDKHDLNHIVTKVLKTLDKQHLFEKADIAKLCNLNPTYPGLRSTLEETKTFEGYRGKVAGRFYFGHPEVIEQLKNEGQLT